MQEQFDTKNRHIAMPNEIFKDMKEWILTGDVQSKHHLEFIYSYYWLVAYVWRYAKYGEFEITQQWFKKALGYNPNEKRLNYLIKKDGVLDQKGYTGTTSDFPVLWTLKDEELSFTMFSDYDKEEQQMINQFKSKTFIVKSPLAHLGNSEDGIFYNSSNTHVISLDVFNECMNNPNLKCAGFFMYGILKYIQDKAIHFNSTSTFEVGNDVLMKATMWDRRKVTLITDELDSVGLIKKSREKQAKGVRNEYMVF